MKRLATIACLSIVLLAVIGCATVPSTGRISPSIGSTVALLETGTVGEILAFCSSPFLFNQEILVRESDVRQLLVTLTETSSSFTPLAAIEAEDSSALKPFFGDSFEVTAFTENYAPATVVVVTISTDFGEIRLLLGEIVDSVRQILGVSIV